MAIEREVSLRISANTEGADKIKALAAEVDKLAAEGGAAAPAFQVLSNELRKLAEQDGAVSTFGALQASVESTATKFRDAQNSVRSLENALQEAITNTTVFREQQVALKNTVDTTGAELRKVSGELRLLKASTDDAGKGTAAYKAEVLALSTAQAELRTKQSEQKAALSQVNAALKEAEQSQKATTAAYEKAVGSQEQFRAELTQQTVALHSAQTAMQQLGLDTIELVAAQDQVAQSFLRVNQELAATESKKQQAAIASERLAQAERELQAALQFEAETARRAVAYENEQAQAAQRLAQAKVAEAEAHALAARAAQEALNGAFGTLGVRSIEAIRKESVGLQQALQTVKAQFEAGTISAGSFSRAVAATKVRMAELQQEANELPKMPGMFERISSSIGGLVSRFGALVGTMATVGIATKPVFDLAIQVDNLRRSLTTITGSAAEAERQIAFLRKTANDSGVAFSDITDSFVRFNASMRSSGMAAELTERVFRNVTNAAGNLGISSDRVSHILDALGQMANKGTVSMEELRQQLGDSLPGALGLLAKGLGITERQLVQVVETGQLATAHALGPLADAMVALGSKGKQVEGLGASFARLKNAIQEAMQRATDSKAFQQLAGIIDFLAKNLTTVIDVTYGFGKALLALKIVEAIRNFAGLGAASTKVAADMVIATEATAANTAQTVANTTATNVNTAAKLENAAATRASAAAVGTATAASTLFGATLGRVGAAVGAGMTAIRGLGAALGGLPGLLLAVIFSYKELGTWIGESAAKLMGWGKVMTDAEAKLKASEDALKKQSAATREVGAEWVKATVQYAEAMKPIGKNIEASEKLYKAKKLEGEAMMNIANLSGSETAAIEASVRAAVANEVASQSVVKARTAEVTTTEALVDKYNQLKAVKGSLNDAERKALEDAENKLKVQRSELEQAREEAAVNTSRVIAAQAASEAYKDNSTRLEELRASYESLSAAAAINERMQAEGVVSTEAVSRSKQAAAVAEALYRDAINDSVKAVEREKNAVSIYTSALGENQRTLDMSAQVSGKYADSLRQSTSMLEQQAARMRESISALQERLKVDAANSESIKAKIVEQQRELDLKQQEIDKTKQATQAAVDEAAARDLAAKTYKDNSDRVAEYGAAAATARAKLAQLIEEQKAGRATSDQVAQATREAAAAEKLYADALADATVKLQNKALLDKAYADQANASIKLAQEQARSEEAVAKAKGNEAAVTQAQIKGKKLEIDARRQAADAMRQEAQNTIDITEQQMRELEATGRLTPEKRAELQARIENAKAKQIEADATDESIRSIQAEIDALQNLKGAKDGAKGGSGSAGLTKGYEISAEQNRLYDFLHNGGKLTEEDRAYVEANFKAAKSNLEIMQRNSGAFSTSGMVSAEARYREALRAMEALGGKSSDSGGFKTDPTDKSTGGFAGTVTINLGGKTTNIKTATPEDQKALMGLFEQLKSEMSRSTL